MRGELRQQAVRGVEFGSVGGGVDGEHHGVETGARDVVRVPVTGPVGRVVVGREHQPGPYRVARVVHGEDGGTGGGGVAHLGVGVVLQGRAQTQGGVHQLLETEDQYAAGVAQGSGYPGGHGGERGFQGGPVGGGEAVPSAVRHTGGPAEIHPGAGPVPLIDDGSGTGLRLVCGNQCPALLQDALREGYRARAARHQVDAGADLRGEPGQPLPVGRRPHVHQGDDDVTAPRVPLVQCADGVEHGVARGELVVHQHQRRVGDGARQGCRTEVARQQIRVLREQQM